MVRKLIDIRSTIPRHKTRKWKQRDSADTIVIHTTGSNNQDPNGTARYHSTPSPKNHLSKAGAPGLAYHDFIDKKGTVYHCNNYTDKTWHCGVWNRRSIGVTMAFMGQTGVAPTPPQYRALKEHLVVLCLYIKILPKRIKGHREVPGIITILGNGSKRYRKTCPGWGVDLDELRDDVTRRLQRRLAAEGLYRGKIDGDFGRKSKSALIAFDPVKPSTHRIAWRYGLK